MDVSRARSRARSAAAAAAYVTAENVLADCTPKVPTLTGALRTSGRVRQAGDGRVFVEWGTDADTARYARPQYHGAYRHETPGVSSPALWFERAERERGRAWLRMFGDEVEARL